MYLLYLKNFLKIHQTPNIRTLNMYNIIIAQRKTPTYLSFLLSFLTSFKNIFDLFSFFCVVFVILSMWFPSCQKDCVFAVLFSLCGFGISKLAGGRLLMPNFIRHEDAESVLRNRFAISRSRLCPSPQTTIDVSGRV